MAFNNVNKVKESKFLTIIPNGSRVKGKIISLGSIRIDGVVEGEISAIEKMEIGKEGKVEGKVSTKDAIIIGSFKGNMNASGEVEISSTGKFIGSLTQKDARLNLARGGLFKGENIIGTTLDKVLPKLLKNKKD